MNKIVDDFEKYELVMRQMRKVLIRMDEVLLECTNITPEEYSEWNKFFESLFISSTLHSSERFSVFNISC